MTEQKTNRWYKPWTWFDRNDHTKIRQAAKTLNALNVIEILVTIFFAGLCAEVIWFIMAQIAIGNTHTVLAVLATGVTVPIAGLVFGMLKNINSTFENKDKD